MIAYLQGTILKKIPKGIILNSATVGYFVHLSNNFLATLQEQQELQLFIHSHIREDAFDLYGFNNYQELNFFKNLISISGIGPKIALEILNNDANKIKAAIINEDHHYLCKIPGIGQKTAKRLILELKNKIEIEDPSQLTQEYKNGISEIYPEVVDALLRLGYGRYQINKTLRDLPSEIKKAEEIITYFLRNI